MAAEKVIALAPDAPMEEGVTGNQCQQMFADKDGALLCCVRKASHPPPCHVLGELDMGFEVITNATQPTFKKEEAVACGAIVSPPDHMLPGYKKA